MFIQRYKKEDLKKQFINETKIEVFNNYYHPSMSRIEAEEVLEKHFKKFQINGCFLVRPCSKFPNSFALSFINEGKCNHSIIKHEFETYYSIDGEIANGVDYLIKTCQEAQMRQNFALAKEFIPGQILPANTRVLGTTNPLHQAATNKIEKYRLILLLNSQYCPDINERDEEGRTALDIACEYDNVEAIKELMKKKPSTNLRALDGYTPLHRAAKHNAFNAIDYLLTFTDADPTERLIDDYSVALHISAAFNSLMSVKTLLRFNLPAKPRTKENKTPLDIAVEKGWTDIIAFFGNYEPTKSTTMSTDWLHESDVTRDKAQAMLISAQLGEGSFLVRHSVRKSNLFVLTLMKLNDEFFNYEIHQTENQEYYIHDSPLFSSLNYLIEHFMRFKDGLATLLKHPIAPQSNEENLNESDFLTLKSVDEDGIRKDKIIHDGRYTTIYAGIAKSSKKVALKVLKDKSKLDSFIHESKIMEQLVDHSNIVSLFTTIHSQNESIMVQELMLCSLLDKLYEIPCNVTDQNLKMWTFDIVSGMEFIESKQIVHCDLAARNILLGFNLEAKISDFGLSRAYNSESNTKFTDTDLPIRWYAPETIEQCEFTFKSDVWSFGVTLWEMWTNGGVPYGEKTEFEVYEFIKDGNRLEKPEKCSEYTYKLMKKCWRMDENKRPSFKDINQLLVNSQEYMSIFE